MTTNNKSTDWNEIRKAKDELNDDADISNLNSDDSFVPISEENKAAIAQYVAAGGAFAISTGRMPSGILSRAQELGLKGMVCCCQGAIILDIETGAVISEGRLSLDSTIVACKLMEELGLHIHVYDLWDFYVNMDDWALKMYENAVKSKGKLVLDQPLSEFIKEQGLCAYKLLAMVEPKDSERLLEELFKHEIDGCDYTKSADFLVEIINKNYSKGTAVEFLANYYGTSKARTIAIGDQRNDLSMLEVAGLGVAVKNADEALKTSADYVSAYTNDENAVADIIYRFGFCKEE